MADMLTVEELEDLRLGSLKTAVDDWETMHGRLEKLADGGDGDVSAAGLKKEAEAADWKGLNATVTRQFVTKTAAQFDDAAAAAKSVLGLLRGAHTEFTQYKSDLRTAIDELAKQNIYVNGKGGVVDASPPPHVAGDADVQRPTQQQLDAAQERIDRILWEAAETDRIVARALRALAKNKYDFTDRGPEIVAEADRRQGEADARYWNEQIAKGNVDEWSEEKLARFNETLRDQRDNPGFTETFAVGLGGEGTLQFWRDLAAPPGGAVEGDRAKVLAHVQDNLSMALANASHSDSPQMEAWKREVIAAGSKTFPVDPDLPLGPKGFQVASSLMHKGKFDTEFLHDYGQELVKYEREHGADPDALWRDTTSLTYPPDENPNDPFAGFMDALGHNPEASVEFFGKSTGEGEDEVSNFDYLVGDGDDARDWPLDDEGKPMGYDNLGHALESATLGYPYDDKSPSSPPLDTPEQIEARENRLDLVSRIVERYDSADVIDGQPGIRDSLANIAAGHIDSLNYSTANWGGSGELTDRDGLFNKDERHLRDLGQRGTVDFLRALASDQDSYNTLSSAQQLYGTSLIAVQGDNQDDALYAGYRSVRMHGLLDEARAESIGEQYADDEAARNKALEQQAEWRKFVVGSAVGVGVGVASGVVVPAGAAAAVAVPLAFETVGGAVGTHMSTETIDWLDEKEYSNDQQAIAAIEDHQDRGRRSAMVPLLNYMEDQEMSTHEVRKYVFNAEARYRAGALEMDTDNSRGH
ncbi:DUF6571 family protein [Streptomyces sp. JJ36]|uniref:DUF6571 family protein n=1 Tax=Streptomyces sp. JJ36 TaxID=2736645 RepID=UPI001F348423|nr:DUF6571 family protein [Streptomyces sp. JJ36]MCF6523390.1 hypothetical protein [Streptomyces sp. JJ36]